ncbi:PP2C family protein-serine/threonine phosphatase, partial [Streptomyces hirsutus]|uniref:PP2C family protein-serine/threonine phosphatase n=1 Tax=Streptomyces hirsutus TaxID=35620 RepID=UPI00363ACF60
GRVALRGLSGLSRGAPPASVGLLGCDPPPGVAEAVDAGSPRMWRLRGKNVDALPFDAQLPLGMFEDTPYTSEHFQVRPGDRFLIGSDGVYDATSSAGEKYSERALARALMATRLLPPAQVPGAVLRELATYRGESPVDDDALVVCLDWYGRTGDGSRPGS